MIINADNLFLFLDKAPKINVSLSRLGEDRLWVNPAYDLNSTMIGYLNGVRKPPEVIELYPYDIFVASPRDPLGRMILGRAILGGTLPICNITKVDYRDVVDTAEVTEDEAHLIYQVGGVGEILDLTLEAKEILELLRLDLDMAQLQESLVLYKTMLRSEFEMVDSGEEPMPADAGADVMEPERPTQAEQFDTSKRASVSVTGVESNTHSILKNYLGQDNQTVREKVPNLVGDSGVAKSELVKSMAKKMGYRFIDFRAQFLIKVDLEGFKSFVRDKDGELVSRSAPHSKIISATDEYIEASEQKLKEIQEYLELDTVEVDGKSHTISKEEKEALLEIVEKLKEESKPAVIFFDEIYRASIHVAQALTSILNSKKFLEYNIRRSKVVAASNVPLAYPDQMEGFYESGDVVDKAYLDRFTKIQVTPLEMAETWWAWMKNEDEGNFHEAVIKYVDGNLERSFDLSEVSAAIAGAGEGAAKTTSFPNFRTWEFISSYLIKVEAGDAPYNPGTIISLLGNKNAEPFMKYLEANFESLTQAEPEFVNMNEFDKGIDAALSSKTPLMMLGASSIGKTVKLTEWAEKHNYYLQVVNLAQKDRADIMGLPAKKGLFSDISAKLPVESPARHILEDMSGLRAPVEISDYVPDLTLKKSIERSKIQPVIIYFTEFNRATPEVRSAIFEAISSNRFGSVTWDPVNVQIVCDGNIGEDYQVGDIDPAFVARFSLVRKDSLDPEDIPSVLQYMRDKEWDPTVIKYFESRSAESLIEILNRTEDISEANGTTNLRSFSELSNALVDAKSKVFVGKNVHDVPSEFVRGNIVVKGSEDLNARLDSLMRFLSSDWAGFSEEISFNIDDRQMNGLQAQEEFAATVESIRTMTDITTANEHLRNLSEIVTALITQSQAEIMQKRSRFVRSFLGTSGPADDFADYYDQVAGRDVIKYHDIGNKGDALRWTDLNIPPGSSPDDWIKDVRPAIEKFSDTFDSKNIEARREIFEAFFSTSPGVEARERLLKVLTTNAELQKALISISSNDFEDDSAFMGRIFGVRLRESGRKAYE